MSNRAVIILDESGSMFSRISDTVGAIQLFISEQRRLTPDLLVTLVTFNSSGERTVWEDKPVQQCTFTRNDLYPNGNTPLLDAIGHTVNRFKRRKGDKVVVAILTDGQENSSSEFSKADIQRIIEKKNPRNWQFAYLGVGLDDIQDGLSSGFNIRSSNVYGTFTGATTVLAAASSDFYSGSTDEVTLNENVTTTP